MSFLINISKNKGKLTEDIDFTRVYKSYSFDILRLEFSFEISSNIEDIGSKNKSICLLELLSLGGR